MGVVPWAGFGRSGRGSGGKGGVEGAFGARVTPRFAPPQVQWLLDNYETAEGVSLPRSALYCHYLLHCQGHKLEPVNAASFGKLIRSVFMGLRTRRLGTRSGPKNPEIAPKNPEIAPKRSCSARGRHSAPCGWHSAIAAPPAGGTAPLQRPPLPGRDPRPAPPKFPRPQIPPPPQIPPGPTDPALFRRGNSKYHYYGLRIKAGSPLLRLVEDQQHLAMRQQPFAQKQR